MCEWMRVWAHLYGERDILAIAADSIALWYRLKSTSTYIYGLCIPPFVLRFFCLVFVTALEFCCEWWWRWWLQWQWRWWRRRRRRWCCDVDYNDDVVIAIVVVVVIIFATLPHQTNKLSSTMCVWVCVVWRWLSMAMLKCVKFRAYISENILWWRHQTLQLYYQDFQVIWMSLVGWFAGLLAGCLVGKHNRRTH